MKLLDKKEFSKLTDRVKNVPFNTLFARAVVEKKVTGRIYVDSPSHIKTAYIIHPYGMTLLLGDTNQEDFTRQFKMYVCNTDDSRTSDEWMQIFPPDWEEKLNALFGVVPPGAGTTDQVQEKRNIELYTRVNFTFDTAIYQTRKVEKFNPDIEIVPTDRHQFREMRGTVVPKYFWDTEDDFFAHGMAYSLLYKGELASMAFSSYILDDQFELGIETHPEFRGKGFAEQVCAALIAYCIGKNYEPVWSCRKENIGSYKLAIKLGFQPCLELPYYRLIK